MARMGKTSSAVKKRSRSSVKRAAAKRTTPKAKFDVDKLSPAIKKSPIKLKDWLDLHIPTLIGPRTDSFDPKTGQRGTILTIRGARFAASRSDNEVTIGGVTAPVLAANSTELK